MRRTFAAELHKHMKINDKIIVLVADLGYGMFDKIKTNFPERFYNVGASGQAMMGIGAGMALEGKIPFLYTITPFLLYRGFETIRTYINHESIPVKLIGSGRDRDYSHDGISHWADDDDYIMEPLDKIERLYPHSIESVIELLDYTIKTNKPIYLNLKR